MKRCPFLLLAWVAVLVPRSLHSQTYDLVIQQGRVVDGSGNPASRNTCAARIREVSAPGAN